MGELLQILDRPIAYQRSFVRLGIGVAGAVFLSQMVYWINRAEEGWFYKTQEEWTEETGLSRYEQEGARKKLRDLGILHEKKQGLPAKLFYSIDEDKLYQSVIRANKDAENSHTGLGKTRKQLCGKLANIPTEITTENTTDIKTPLTPEGDETERILGDAKQALEYYNALTGLHCRDITPFLELLTAHKSRAAYTLGDLQVVMEWVVKSWRPRNGKFAKPANICRVTRFDGYLADALVWLKNQVEINTADVVDEYNRILGDRLPQAELDPERDRDIRQLAQHLAVKTVEGFSAYFDAFRQSAPIFYYGGADGAGWRASFDYLINPKILKKTREGTL